MRPGALPLLAGGLIALAVDGWYVSYIASAQPDDLGAPRVWYAALYIAACAALAIGAALRSSLRGELGAGALAGLLWIGVLSLFSIGLPLLVAAVLVGVGLVRIALGGRSSADAAASGRNSRKATAFAVAFLMVAVGVGGLVATQPGLFG